MQNGDRSQVKQPGRPLRGGGARSHLLAAVSTEDVASLDRVLTSKKGVSGAVGGRRGTEFIFKEEDLKTDPGSGKARAGGGW